MKKKIVEFRVSGIYQMEVEFDPDGATLEEELQLLVADGAHLHKAIDFDTGDIEIFSDKDVE